MTPSPMTPSPATAPVTASYLSAADAVGEFLAAPAVAGAWDMPSVLPRMTVAALAGHLAQQVLDIPGLLAGIPVAEPPVTLIDHYQRAAWRGKPVDDPVNVAVRVSGERTAADGAAGLSRRVLETAAGLRMSLPDMSAGRAVWIPWAGWALTLGDFLSTRLLEIVVHADDLACSVNVAPPRLPEAATDATVALLARLAARRHGIGPVLRALSREERAPASIVAI